MAFEGLTGYDIEMTEIRTIYQLRNIKVGLQLRFPILMGNIIKILLYMKEEKLACYLTAFYDIQLDAEEKLLNYGVKNNYFEWLNYVWAFKKNMVGDEKRKIDIENLFTLIKKNFPLDDKDFPIEKKLETCCEWYLDNAVDKTDNILKALLTHQEDALALKFMGYYSVLLDDKLFLFSLEKNNQDFIRESLDIGAFDKNYFKEDDVVEEILRLMQYGAKTNFLLNTLLLIDISVWSFDQAGDLIDKIDLLADTESVNDNNLLLSNNPLMSISLSCELLDNIGSKKAQFEEKCAETKENLLELGKVFNSRIDSIDDFEALIFNTDFQNRTVLKVITESELEPLMSTDDPKAENIMN